MPGFVVFEMLSPVIELSGYLLMPLLWAMGSLSIAFTSTFLVIAILYAVLVSVLAVHLLTVLFRKAVSPSEVLLFLLIIGTLILL